MPLPVRVAVAVLACGLAGCAHTYVAADGSRHVVGLVWLTLPPTASDGEALRVRALGLSAVRTPAGAALVLGYGENQVVLVREGSVVDAAALLANH